MLCKHEANPEENNNAEARSQQSRFATLIKTYLPTDTSPKICKTSAEHPPLGEHPRGIASFDMFKRLKDLNYKKFLFTIVKINLLTLKMDK